MQNVPGGQAEARKALEVPEFIFVNWREMLNQEPLAVPARRACVQAIEAYLDHCRNNGVSVRVPRLQWHQACSLWGLGECIEIGRVR